MNKSISKFNDLVSSASVKNFLWLSSDKIFKLLISLFVGVWIARYLGPNDLGKLNYILAFVTILTAISSLGMDSFLVKELLSSDSEEGQDTIMGTSFVLRLIASIVFAFIIYIILLLSELSPELYYLYFLMIVPVLLSPLELIDIEYQSKLKSKKTIISKNIGYILGTILKIYVLIIGKGLIWFALIVAIEAVVSYFSLVISYQLDNNLMNWKFDIKKVSNLLKNVWPFVLSNAVVILYMRLDQIMLGNMVGVNSVGQFSAAIKIAEMFTFLPIAISSSYFPSLIKAKEFGNEIWLSKLRSYFKAMSILSISISFLLSVFSDLIIRLLYGNQYIDAIGILAIYSWTLFPVFLGVALGQYLVIEGLQRILLYRALIGLGSNIFLNILLIPYYGAIGAAIATLISYLISAIISNMFFRQTRKIFFSF